MLTQHSQESFDAVSFEDSRDAVLSTSGSCHDAVRDTMPESESLHAFANVLDARQEFVRLGLHRHVDEKRHPLVVSVGLDD